jgi:hypothetical protein
MRQARRVSTLLKVRISGRPRFAIMASTSPTVSLANRMSPCARRSRSALIAAAAQSSRPESEREYASLLVPTFEGGGQLGNPCFTLRSLVLMRAVCREQSAPAPMRPSSSGSPASRSPVISPGPRRLKPLDNGWHRVGPSVKALLSFPPRTTGTGRVTMFLNKVPPIIKTGHHRCLCG